MTATESLFFGTINDFCNKICHKRTHTLQQKHRYSITSSARPSSASGTVKPSARAVLRSAAQHCGCVRHSTALYPNKQTLTDAARMFRHGRHSDLEELAYDLVNALRRLISGKRPAIAPG
jgi:hypothetical protein